MILKDINVNIYPIRLTIFSLSLDSVFLSVRSDAEVGWVVKYVFFQGCLRNNFNLSWQDDFSFPLYAFKSSVHMGSNWFSITNSSSLVKQHTVKFLQVDFLTNDQGKLWITLKNLKICSFQSDLHTLNEPRPPRIKKK